MADNDITGGGGNRRGVLRQIPIIGEFVDDTFSQDQQEAYKPHPESFTLGGDPITGEPGYARGEHDRLANTGWQQNQNYQTAGNDYALKGEQQGYGGMLQARGDASRLDNRGQAFRSDAGSAAAGYGNMGYGQAASAGYDATGYGTAGKVAATDARQDAYEYGLDASKAQQRSSPYIDTSGANKYSDMADQARGLGFDSRAQGQDARAYQVTDRGQQYGAVGRVRDFYQQGPGPSAAEAQLNMGAEKNMAAALALARSGRGAGVDANAERQALFQNAATGQELNQQQALLRAQEADAWRGRQLQAMGLEQSGLGNIAEQSQGIREGDAATRAQDMQLRVQDLQAQGMSFSQAQAQAQMEADQSQRNDAMTLGLRGFQESAATREGQLGLNYAQLQEQAKARGMTAEQYFAELQETARARGDQTSIAYDQLGVQRQAQGDDFMLGMYGMGLQQQLGMYGLGADTWLGAEGLAAGVNRDQLLAAIEYERIRAGGENAARGNNAASDQSRDGSNMLILSSILGSDVRAKKDIKLEDIDKEYGLDHAKTRKAEQEARALGYQRNSSPYDNIDAASDAAGPDAWQQFRQMAPAARPDWAAPAQQGGGGGGIGGILGGALGQGGGLLSDENSKQKIESLTAEVEALRSSRGTYPDPEQPDFGALDQAQGNDGGAFDLRPAQGYSYEYKQPDQPGAAPGRQYGPMAQDLLKSPATASTVKKGPTGQLAVDTSRLSLVNTAAIGQQQREQDELEQQVRALLAAQRGTEQGIRGPRATYPGGF